MLTHNLMLCNDEEEKVDNAALEEKILNNKQAIFIIQDDTAIKHFSTIVKNTFSNFFLINLNGNEQKLKEEIKSKKYQFENVFFLKGIDREDVKEIKNLSIDSKFFERLITSTSEFIHNLLK